MGYISEGFREVRANRDKKLSGGFNSIPFGYKKLQHYVPGIQKSNYTIVTANSGVGKSKFIKNMYVFRPFDFLKLHPELNIKLTTLYFCLEETRRAFAQSLMCYKLRTSFGERVSIKELRSQLDPEDPSVLISEEILDKIKSMKDYFVDFEKEVIVIDDVRRPYAIYKKVEEYMMAHGDFNMVIKDYYSVKEKKIVRGPVRDRYVPDDPEHYVQVVIDHISLLEPEKEQTVFDAILKLSSTYLVDLRNKFGCSIVVAQQQSADKERQIYTYKGASIESKLEPSLDGLGDCKLTQRDADEVFGVFAPDRYEIPDHRKYNIKILRDNYRSFSILKYRDGNPNLRMGFLFDGATNYIAELPPADKMLADPALYAKALNVVGRTI